MSLNIIPLVGPDRAIILLLEIHSADSKQSASLIIKPMIDSYTESWKIDINIFKKIKVTYDVFYPKT